MSFLKRLFYYLAGFSVGIILLMFFLGGKKTRCTYGPQARVLSDFSKKEWVFNPILQKEIDREKFLKGGKIIFSESEIGTDSCNTYRIKIKTGVFNVKNCDSIAYFTKF